MGLATSSSFAISGDNPDKLHQIQYSHVLLKTEETLLPAAIGCRRIVPRANNPFLAHLILGDRYGYRLEFG